MDMNNVWAWSIAAVVVLAVVIFWAIHVLIIRPRRDTFKDDGVFLELNAANGVIHVESSKDLKAVSLKLGCGQLKFTPQYESETKKKWHSGTSGRVTIYGTGGSSASGTVTPGTEGWWEDVRKEISTGRTHVTIEESDPVLAFHQRWATHPDVKWRSTEKTLTSFYLSSRAARALQRWAKAHQHHIEPNEKVIRRNWEQSCKGLLDACRQIPEVRRLKKSLEVFDYNTTPAIRYLAIGVDGTVFFKTLTGDNLDLDFGQVQGEGSNLWVPLPSGVKERFHLAEAQISKLHQIRRQWQKRPHVQVA